MNDWDMAKALADDGEKLRQITGEEHGPFCPRCLFNPLGKSPIYLGREHEGHICGDCWMEAAHASNPT